MDAPHITVTGLVGESVELRAADLAALPSVIPEVSSIAAGASGTAVRVDDILARVAIDPAASHCTVISQGGAYRASIPLTELRNGGWLAFGDGAEPLADHRGGPFRLTVAEGTTLCWNVKRVATLRLTAGPEPDDVPENPPH